MKFKTRLQLTTALAVVFSAWLGCGRETQRPTKAFQPQLCCESWTNSASAFERMLSTNLYAVVEANRFKVRWKKDGDMTKFWSGDDGYKTLDELKRAFGMSIDFHVQKAMYDAFDKL